MLPEQSSLMIEFIKSSNIFNKELSNGVRAKIWREIAEQCNALPGGRQRTVDQYKRHWYDLKMKVKNKILRRQEALSIPGTETIPDYMELTEEDLFVAKFVRKMEGMPDIIDEALKSVKTKMPRTREQTAMLLKLVHSNNQNFRKLDMSQRQNIWRDIAKTLNQMNGPVKSVDGWKKAYWSWRLQAGDDYEKELERWIKRAPAIPSPKNYDEEFVSDSLTENSTLVQEDYDESTVSAEQEERLFKLIIENKSLLRTGNNDEPLKLQIWRNIAGELNSMPGITLTADEWRKRGNLGRKNPTHWRRKQKNSLSSDELDDEINNCKSATNFGTDDLSKVEFEIMNSEDFENELSANKTTKNFAYDDPDDVMTAEPDNGDFEALLEDYNSDHEFPCMNDDDEQLHAKQQQRQKRQLPRQQRQQQRSARQDSTPTATDCDEDPSEYKPQIKRLKTLPPIVKSFKFNHRIADAVEKLSGDVKEIKDVLRHTSNSLASLEELMERQSEKQNETNALLKRNNQLLKILIEFKTGKRKNSDN